MYLGNLLYRFGSNLIDLGALLAQRWLLLVPFRIHSYFRFISVLPFGTRSCRKHLRPTAIHPRRNKPLFQGHVRNLAEGNLRTDDRVINDFNICNCLHWIQIYVPLGQDILGFPQRRRRQPASRIESIFWDRYSHMFFVVISDQVFNGLKQFWGPC